MVHDISSEVTYRFTLHFPSVPSSLFRTKILQSNWKLVLRFDDCSLSFPLEGQVKLLPERRVWFQNHPEILRIRHFWPLESTTTAGLAGSMSPLNWNLWFGIPFLRFYAGKLITSTAFSEELQFSFHLISANITLSHAVGEKRQVKNACNYEAKRGSISTSCHILTLTPISPVSASSLAKNCVQITLHSVYIYFHSNVMSSRFVTALKGRPPPSWLPHQTFPTKTCPGYVRYFPACCLLSLHKK